MTSVTAAMPDAFANFHGLGDVRSIFARQDDSVYAQYAAVHPLLTPSARVSLGFRRAVQQPAHTDVRTRVDQGQRQRHQQRQRQRQERFRLDNWKAQRQRLAEALGQQDHIQAQELRQPPACRRHLPGHAECARRLPVLQGRRLRHLCLELHLAVPDALGYRHSRHLHSQPGHLHHCCQPVSIRDTGRMGH